MRYVVFLTNSQVRTLRLTEVKALAQNQGVYWGDDDSYHIINS